MWQCCECQQVVDSRLVAVQRWRKLSKQKPSVIVVRRKGRLSYVYVLYVTTPRH